MKIGTWLLLPVVFAAAAALWVGLLVVRPYLEIVWGYLYIGSFACALLWIFGSNVWEWLRDRIGGKHRGRR